jgi:hypothetical protein
MNGHVMKTLPQTLHSRLPLLLNPQETSTPLIVYTAGIVESTKSHNDY